MDFTETKQNGRSLWCAPAISYHHLSPAEIRSLFAFEQDWLRSTTASPSRSSISTTNQRSGGSISWRQAERQRIHHQDVFRHYVQPQTTAERANWTNLSPDLRAGTQGSSLEGCRGMCEEARGCVQYALSEMGCLFSPEARVGRPAEQGEEGGKGGESVLAAGWLPERVESWADGHGSCGREVMSWTVT